MTTKRTAAKKPPRRWKVCKYEACDRGEDGGPARFLGPKAQLYCCRLCRRDAEVARRPDPRQGERQRYEKGSGRDGTGAQEPERVPQEHGGELLSGGKPGNRGNPYGRKRKALRQLLVRVGGLAGQEIVRRFQSEKDIQDIPWKDLRALFVDSAKAGIGQPMQVKHSGTGANGAIQIAVVGPLPPGPISKGGSHGGG